MAFTLLLVVSCNAANDGTADSPTAVPQTTIPPTPEPSPTVELVSPTAQPTPEPTIEPTTTAPLAPISFSLVGSESDSIVADAEKPSSFQDRLTSTGAALFHEGLFYLFFNDYQGSDWPPTLALVGYATSPNAESWERHEEPIFSTADVPWTEENVSLSSMFVEEDGVWVMYFDVLNEDVVGRATAPSPNGPWTADIGPVLTPDEGDWDENGIVSASVLKVGEHYCLYYASFREADDFGSSGGNPPMSIGMATSDDGISWVKHDDPETAEAPFHLSDPVFEPNPESDWDFFKVESPTVVYSEDDGWMMLYRTDNGHFSWGDGTAYGIALSDDGVSWQRRQDSPVLSEDDFTAWHTVWAVALMRHDGVYYIFTETDGRGVIGTRINLAAYEGLLSH